MNNGVKRVVKLVLATLAAAVAVGVGITFTTIMFQSDTHPDDWGRTWQDNLVIGVIMLVYLIYIYQVIKESFSKK